jgi:beta-glucosidase
MMKTAGLVLAVATLAVFCSKSESKKELTEFPKKFLWGSATAAHQVEGGNHNNDWYRWEELGRIKNGDLSDNGPDHWNRYEEDFKLAKEMGMNTYRFSVEWSRVEPQKDVWDMSAIEHYRKMIKAMWKYGLNPMLTLHHFTTPLWSSDPADPESNMKGWRTRETIDEFLKFAELVIREFAGDVDFWVTINEPSVVMSNGYILGAFPPGINLNFEYARQCYMNQLIAHAKAYDLIKKLDNVDADGDGKSSMVGLALAESVIDPVDPEDAADVAAAKRADNVFNKVFAHAAITGWVDSDLDGKYDSKGVDPEDGYHPEIGNRLDYIGVNYYQRSLWMYAPVLQPMNAMPGAVKNPGVEKTEMGWEIYPYGMYRAIMSFKHYGLPIYITENGIADSTDHQRPKYVRDHLEMVLKAISDGADVRGFYYWALVDNFEWAEGLWPRFGLFRVNYDTKERTKTEGAKVYEQIIKTGKIPDL